jgi:ssDNA-binding Zn-finger/Zn-ribbon topoisomerase 1
MTVWRDVLIKAIFVERANATHVPGSVLYDNLPSEVSVNKYYSFICSLHGEFKQKGYAHLEGKGCPECGKRKRHHIKRDDTIKRFVDFHGKNTYNYDLVPSDIRQASSISIICPIHGIFYQTVDVHYSHGCPKCYHERSKRDQQTTKAEFIERSRDMGFNLGYGLLPEKMTMFDYVTLICPIHGKYKQQVNNHLNLGQGCKQCVNLRLGKERRLGKTTFLARASLVHDNGHYNYDKIPDDFKMTDKVIIHCSRHNIDFEQMAKSHMTGFGCPICGNVLSKRENAISSFIEFLGYKTIRRFVIKDGKCRREIDIFIPDLMIGFEYNGVFWHSSDANALIQKDVYYHANKQLQARKQGIDLFFIWEDTDIQEQDTIIRNVLKGAHVATVKNGLIDKDLCPSSRYLPSNYQIDQELPPSPVFREYRKHRYLTYNSGVLRVSKNNLLI